MQQIDSPKDSSIERVRDFDMMIDESMKTLPTAVNLTNKQSTTQYILKNIEKGAVM